MKLGNRPMRQLTDRFIQNRSVNELRVVFRSCYGLFSPGFPNEDVRIGAVGMALLVNRRISTRRLIARLAPADELSLVETFDIVPPFGASGLAEPNPRANMRITGIFRLSAK